MSHSTSSLQKLTISSKNTDIHEVEASRRNRSIRSSNKQSGAQFVEEEPTQPDVTRATISAQPQSAQTLTQPPGPFWQE